MTMVMTVVLFGAAIGIVLGSARFKVLALLPVLILAAGAIGSRVAAGLEFRAVVLLAAVVSPQITYLASFLAAGFMVAKYQRLRAHVRSL
jgi:hypothetical protein